jgi:AraC-like DNA-binding protein
LPVLGSAARRRRLRHSDGRRAHDRGAYHPLSKHARASLPVGTLRDDSDAALSNDCSVVDNVAVILTALLRTERLLFASDLVCAGTFACAVDDPSFPGGTPSTSHCIVFSRTPVWIQHEGGVRYVADPTVVTFHTRGRTYRRWQIDRSGDRCDWIAFPDDVLRDVRAERTPHVRDAMRPHFERPFAPIGADAYLAQRALFDAIAARRADRLAVEEGAMRLLNAVSAVGYPRARTAASPRSCRREFEAVQDVREQIARTPSRSDSLRALADGVAMSPYQLCRAFTRQFGSTLTAYRTRLRLLSSLEPIAAGEDLTAVALDAGFSSHSHFTSAFRQTFGTVPSRVRVSR